jgi:release factor glutamine methyltransferase
LIKSSAITVLRSASRRARESTWFTERLFGARVDHGVHGDLWDMTTLTLRKTLRDRLRDGNKVLELGTGHVGILAIYAAKLRRVEVVAVDISQAFVDNARRIAAASGAEVAFRQSDWFSNVEGRFDVVFSNLPYLPTAAGEAANASKEHRQIWDGGEDGLDHARTLLRKAAPFLTPRGRLLLGLNTMYVPTARTVQVIAEHGWRLERVVRTRVSPAEVYCCIAPASS